MADNISGLLGDESDQSTLLQALGMSGGGMPLDPETQRRLMMQAYLPAALGQFGASLLAGAQGGLTPAQRAHYIGQAGQAPMAGADAFTRAGTLASQQQQHALRNSMLVEQIQRARRQEANDATIASVLRGGAAPGGGGGGGGAAAPAASGVPGAILPAPDDQLDLAARILHGEAASQGPEGLAAAASVIANRARLTGQHVGQVVTASGQFQPWGDQATRQRLLAMRPEQYAEARRVLEGVLSGQIQDPTGGATHFLNPEMTRQQNGGRLPAWAPEGQGQRIGAHVFYRRPEDFRRQDGGGGGGGGAPLNPDQVTLASAPVSGGGGQAVTPDAILGRLDSTTRALMAANPRQSAQTLVTEAIKAAAATEQYRPVTPAERAQYGLPADRPFAMNRRTNLPVEIGTQGRTTLTERTQQGMLDAALAQYRTLAETSNAERSQFLPVLEQFRALSGQMQGGGPANAVTLPLRQLMAQAGMLTPEAAQSANIETIMQSLTTRMAPLVRQAGSGTMSDRDVALFLQSIPTISQTPVGRAMVADGLERAIRWREADVALRGQYIQQNGHLNGYETWARPQLPGLSIPVVRTYAEYEALPAGSAALIDNTTIRAALGLPPTGVAAFLKPRREQ